MFGKGLYFADMSSKSANYCYVTPSKNTGLVLLSEVSSYCWATTLFELFDQVALGQINELLEADNHANRLPKGVSSVKGLGSIAPNTKNMITLWVDISLFFGETTHCCLSNRDDGVMVPMGPADTTSVVNPKGYTLNYNEYIVYDTKQVRMRYLIKLKFLFK